MAWDKIDEIFLNFGLVTIIGGCFTFVLSALRDEEAKRQSVLSAIRDLLRQVDELYRSTKQTKRMIRSRLKETETGQQIEAAFFAARMDDLSNTQLKLEQIRNAVRTRPDLFDEDRQRRILRELEYPDKYIHDVVEEFEKRVATWDGAACHLSPLCVMLADFLGGRWKPPELRKEFELMEDADTSPERYDGFLSIVEAVKRIDPKSRRHKSISDKCLLLAMREMRDTILESKPRLNLQRLTLGPRARVLARHASPPGARRIRSSAAIAARASSPVPSSGAQS